jgi:hypothetical protein
VTKFVISSFKGRGMVALEMAGIGTAGGVAYWLATETFLRPRSLEQILEKVSPRVREFDTLGYHSPRLPMLCDEVLRALEIYAPEKLGTCFRLLYLLNSMAVCCEAADTDSRAYSYVDYMCFSLGSDCIECLNDVGSPMTFGDHPTVDRRIAPHVQEIYSIQEQMLQRVKHTILADVRRVQ